MPAAPRRGRISSTESSDKSSSDDEDIPSTFGRSTTNKTNELTLKDDEDTIDFQAPLPEYYGKLFNLFNIKYLFN